MNKSSKGTEKKGQKVLHLQRSLGGEGVQCRQPNAFRGEAESVVEIPAQLDATAIRVQWDRDSLCGLGLARTTSTSIPLVNFF
eukprot:5426792-Amphidinium_carterae.1